MDAAPNTQLIDDLIKQRLDELLPQKLEAALEKRRAEATPSMTIIRITSYNVCYTKLLRQHALRWRPHGDLRYISKL